VYFGRDLRAWGHLLIALIAVGAGACGPTALAMFPVGGRWHMYLHQSFLIEAGHRPSDLYREWKLGRVLVATDVEFHEYYKQPDCLLWETEWHDHIVFAACGEREPMIVTSDDYHRWKMEPRGLVYEGDDGVNAQGVPVRPTAMFTLDSIAAASARQPAFSGAQIPNVAPTAPPDLQPLEEDMPIDVTATNSIGRNALHEAAGGSEYAPSRLPLVNALIEHGADVNAVDKGGTTALMIAANHAHADVVKRLIAAGADIHARDDDGRTALMEAAGSLDNQVEMVTELLKRGADKEIRDKYGRTAFSAIRTNTDPQLKVLLALK